MTKYALHTQRRKRKQHALHYTHTAEIAKIQNPHGSSEGSISNSGGGDSGTSNSGDGNGTGTSSSTTKKSIVAAMPLTSRVPSRVVRRDARASKKKGRPCGRNQQNSIRHVPSRVAHLRAAGTGPTLETQISEKGERRLTTNHAVQICRRCCVRVRI